LLIKAAHQAVVAAGRQHHGYSKKLQIGIGASRVGYSGGFRYGKSKAVWVGEKARSPRNKNGHPGEGAIKVAKVGWWP
jgi:hypothetical protein